MASLLLWAAPFVPAQEPAPPPVAPVAEPAPPPAARADPFMAPRPPRAPAPPPNGLAGGASGGSISLEAAVPGPPAAGYFTERLRNIIRRAQGGAGGAEPLVVRFSDMTSKEQSQLEEDLAIMSHILVKNAGGTEPGAYTAMGIAVANPGGATPARAFYLEGYGAVFTLEVGFPLVQPAAAAQPNSEPSQTNSDWEQAKQEMFGGGAGGGAGLAMSVEPMDPTTGLPMAAQSQYNEQRVKHLREGVLKSLKDAANIRGLKADDWVAVTVFNRALQPPVPTRPMWMAMPGGPRPNPGREPAGPRRTVLALRARFSDVKALAEGSLSLDKFRKQVEVQTYAVTDADSGGSSAGGYGAAGGY
jgi:hypothetical protein